MIDKEVKKGKSRRKTKMIINHNMNALNAHRNMNINNTNAGKSMEKLSSGLRINRAGDDAAGLAISEKMRGQIRGLTQASRNASDGISLVQTAEGALNETTNILQRMRELAVQSANDTNLNADREQIQKEVSALIEEIDRIANNTEFNEQKLLDGNFAGKLQVGANASQSIDISVGGMGATDLKVNTVKVDSQSNANAAIKAISDAIETVSGQRADLGAIQNRLEYTISNLDNTAENLTSAESTLRDVDMAKEMMEYSKNNILNQAAQSMIAQANQQPQNVLQLLR